MRQHPLFTLVQCPYCIDAAAADYDDVVDDGDDDVVDDGDDDGGDYDDDDDGDDDAEVKCLERWDEVTNSIIGESTTRLPIT